MINAYMSWRALTLAAVLMVGFALLVAESDNLATLFATKIAAIGCGLLFAVLFSKWETEGKIKELSDYVNKED